jgi:hypothetical protein
LPWLKEEGKVTPSRSWYFFLSPFFHAFSIFCPSFFFPGAGKKVRTEWQMMHKDIGLHKGDCQLQIPWHRWSTDWALSDAIRGLVNYVYPPPLLLTHGTSYNNKEYRSRIPYGPSKARCNTHFFAR